MSRDQAQIKKLAKQVGAKIHMTEPDLSKARSTPYSREVFVSRPDAPGVGEDNWFWTTLHELGHIAGDHAGSGMLYLFGLGSEVAEQEAEAWTWAIDHAGRPLDATGRAVIAGTLTSYLQPHQNVLSYGPNLRRVVDLVGPNPDVNLMAQIEPQYYRLAARLWQQLYPKITNELAVAA